LAENFNAALDEVMRAKPASSKGNYLKKAVMSSNMGPGIQVDTSGSKISAPAN
jgi:large subunit ribosomal protein L1